MSIIRFGKTFRLTILLILLFELLSYLGWYYSGLNLVVFWLLVIGVFLLAWKRLDIALGVVLVELFIGSKGYLFYWTLSDLNISIRLGLFTAIFLAWFFRYFIKGKVAIRSSNIFWWYIGFLVIYAWGVINGFLRGNLTSNIFFDANGFLYFGIFFIFYEAINNSSQIKKILQIMLASIVGIGLKTLALLFLFAGQYSFLPELYRWVRDTRVNEVTLITSNFYRIFSQSQIYSLFAFIILLTILTIVEKKKLENSFWQMGTIFIIASLSVLISYSRSFWLSLGVVFLLMIYVFIRNYNFDLKKTSKYLVFLLIILVAQIGYIFAFINLPNWLRVGGETTSLTSLVEERLGDTQEAALQSRWNLIEPLARKMIHNPVLGAGFGTEVTYLSEDPRLVETNGGIYSTFVFEWGYFDIILKIGLLGLIIYILFIWKITQNGLKAFKVLEGEWKVLVLGFLFGILALVITHITTPYLNHPLGIGFLMISAVIFERLINESKSLSQNND